MRALLAFLRRRWRWIVSAYAAWLVVWLLLQGVTAEQQVMKRADKLRQALEDKDFITAGSFISDDYRDAWKYSKADVELIFQDVVAQFLSLEVEWVDPDFAERADGGWDLTARARLDGQAITPPGSYILSQVAQVKKPFRFVWRKEGWMPWSWHVVRVENDALHIPPEYKPGSLSTNRPSLEDFFAH